MFLRKGLTYCLSTRHLVKYMRYVATNLKVAFTLA